MRKRLFMLAAFAAFILFGGTAHAQAHSISLKWTASTDANAGYNVYRAAGACPASGTSGFAKVTASPVAATSFVDNSVAVGAYCYYATSVVSGAESLPSNLAPAVILPAAPTTLSITGTT